MKKITLLLLVSVLSIGAKAQPSGGKEFARRLVEARLAEMCLRLELSDEAKDRFIPVYEQYCKDLQAIRPKPMPQKSPKMKSGEAGRQKGTGMQHTKGEMTKKGNLKPSMSDAEKVKNIKNMMEAQHQAHELRLVYMEKFSAILTDNQLVRFYEVEDDIQRRLHERANMGVHAGKGKK